MDKRIEKTMENLKKNNMQAFFVKDKEEIPAVVKQMLKPGDMISCGGSVTLSECGVTDLMRSGEYNFLDRDVARKNGVDLNDLYRQTFSADVFLTSANAVTEKGELINVDGNGNRVAAITYGPKSVICIVGANKLVESVEEGFKRAKTVAAPKNAVRLNTNTPCKELGHCIYAEDEWHKGCAADDRLCVSFSVTGYQRDKNRIKVIICNDSLGY